MNDLAHDLRNERPLDTARERVEALTKTANEWLQQVPEIHDEETARRADDFLSQITAELKKLDTAEKAEKQPLRDQITEIGQRYLNPRALLNTAKDLLTPRIAAWLRRQREKISAERQAQQEDSRRLLREAEEAARIARARPTVENVVAEETAAMAWHKVRDEVERPMERAQIRGNYSSRARTLRVLWRAEITDQLQLYLYYVDHPDVIAVLQRLANAEAPAAQREGRKIPGAQLVAKEIAA